MRRSFTVLLGCTLVTALFLISSPTALSGSFEPEKPVIGGQGNNSNQQPGTGAAKTTQKYFLHYSGAAEATCASSALSLSMKDDADGATCGYLGPPPMITCEVADMCDDVGYHTFAAREPTNTTVKAQYPGEAHIFVTSKVPDQVRVSATIMVGSLMCSAYDGEPRNMLPDKPQAFDLTCMFGGGINVQPRDATEADGPPSKDGDSVMAGSSGTGPVSIEVMIESVANYYVGFEGSTASWMQFTADPPEPKNNTGNKTEPKVLPAGKAPGPMFALGAFTLLALVEVVRRRQA